MAWKKATVPSLSDGGHLLAVTAESTGNAWAVGDTGVDQTLVLHWNGSSWKRVPSPSPSIGGLLLGVAVKSATNAWAVGETASDNPDTVTLHWDGHRWRRAPSPSPGPSQENFAALNAVAELSTSNVWAVGTSAGATESLVLHWNGHFWKRFASPN